MKAQEAYDELVVRSKERAYLGSAMGVLGWDQRTYIPPNAGAHRANQLAVMAGMLHRMVVDPRIGQLLHAAEGSGPAADPTTVEAVNIREWRRTYDKITKIPEDLAVALARAASEGHSAWEKARPENDWNAFRPYLERIVELKLEQAECLGYTDEPYDALLDGYEQGETAAELRPLFSELAQALTRLVDRIQGSSIRRNPDLPDLYFTVADQEEFGRRTAEMIGYDFQSGRLDVSAHPFTSGIGPGDVRITTRYSELRFNEGFFGLIHEAGHGIHHQGLPLDHWGTPFCGSISLGVGESQSRMWENMVARSRSFWEYFYPLALQTFACLGYVSLDDFLFTVNEVSPSLIRVEADEVTYNLHVLLRFELESALMKRALSVADLPDAWNEKMEQYLGVRPPDFASGVMQDVHWAGGAIGYFPTYTLGNLYAAQLFDRAAQDVGDLDALFAEGSFSPLKDWLREKIHRQGTRFLPRDLLRHATGGDLDSGFLITYLEDKYGRLYNL